MPQKLSSVTLDVANCFLQMAVKVAKGTISESDQFQGAVGAVVVKNGDVLGEGQAHLKTGDELDANCKATSKAEQRAMMDAMANVEKDELKGATMYLSFVDSEGAFHQLHEDDWFNQPSVTSKMAGVVGWVLPYDGNHVYMFTRRELLRG